MPTHKGLTMKGGRYGGRGDALQLLRIGEHAPSRCTPLSWLPAFPDFGRAIDGDFFLDLLTIIGETDPRLTVSLTEAGAGESTITYGPLGLILTTDANDNDAVRFQSLPTFTPAANKRAVAATRVRLEDATQSDYFFGFYATQTDPVGTEPLHGAYFKKDDGAATMVGRTNDAGATGSSTATLLTLSDAVDVDLVVGIECTSASAGTVYFASKLASSSTWSQVAKTTDFPAAATRFSICWQAGEAGAIAATHSRGFAWWER